jgi:glucan biosynthesis protein C
MTQAPTGLARVGDTARLAFLDPIRIGLTALVILHHTSIAYGGSGNWYYHEAGAPEWTERLLSVFTGVNQSFFMGFFFLLAGYLMPPSIARKGRSSYLGDRLVRLWLPMIVFGYLLEPLAKALAAGAAGGDVLAVLIAGIRSNSFGLGPLWFNQALLIGTLLWCYLSSRSSRLIAMHGQLSLHATIALAIVGCAVLAFALRLVVPVGQNVFGVQLGYGASYLILFFGGAWAAGDRWLERITWRHAAPWLMISTLTMPTLWIVAIAYQLIGSPLWRGGWNYAALHYALWEPLVAAGIILSSLALARRRYAHDRPAIKTLAQASYAAFVVHAPVSVACSVLVHNWASAHFIRFLLAGALSCILSFAIGIVVTRSLASQPIFPALFRPA